jgi:bcr-type benzoyl-CoA reductase subunit C
MMSRLQEIIATLEDIASHPAQAVRKSMQVTGKKAVGCFPLYTPEEIIYAAGMLPIGMWGGQTEIKQADSYLQSFCCSIMRENLEQGMSGTYDLLTAAIIPAYCDTLKCLCENWKVAVPQVKAIPMVYPQNRKTPSGIAYMIDEYRRVIDEIESLAGVIITEEELLKSIALYEGYRRTMRKFAALSGQYPMTLNARVRHAVIKAGFFCDKRMHATLVGELLAELKQLPKEENKGIKVVLTGILAEPDALLDTFIENNIVVVADDLAQESRQFRTSVSKGENALELLAYRMANQSCALLYDETKSRGMLLKELVRDNKADGVVIVMMIYKKELEAAGIPMLYLEIEQKMDSIEQIRTRVQAFTEMVKHRKY